MNPNGNILKVFENKLWVSRVLLLAALVAPTASVLIAFGPVNRQIGVMLWAIMAGMVVSLSGRKIYYAAQVALLISTPAVVWWIGYATMYGVGPGWEAAIAATQTNALEAMSAMFLAFKNNYSLATLSAYVALLLMSVFTGSVFAKSKPETASEEKIRKSLLALALIVGALATITSMANRREVHIFNTSDRDFSMIGTAINLSARAVDDLLYGDLLEADSAREPGVAEAVVSSPMIGVFVIGESMRAGAIGRGKVGRGPWTKALNDRVDRGLGMWLPTTCASSYATHQSVPMLVAGIVPSEKDKARKAASVLATLKASGFRTAWLTNQDTSVFQERGHDYYWSRGVGQDGEFDESLLSITSAFIEPALKREDAGPMGVVWHMMGSHFEYKDRYPAGLFDVEPKNLNESDLADLRYGHSVEYSAKIIEELLAMLDRARAPAFVVFTSDHGENLPSDKNGLVAHLGPRASIKDGTTTSFVFWNEKMAKSGAVVELEKFKSLAILAQSDVANIFLKLAGAKIEPLNPNLKPEIYAPIERGGVAKAQSCRLLSP